MYVRTTRARLILLRLASRDRRRGAGCLCGASWLGGAGGLQRGSTHASHPYTPPLTLLSTCLGSNYAVLESQCCSGRTDVQMLNLDARHAS